MAKTEYQKINLNDHLAEIIEIHFDPKGGTPFWLKKQEEIGLKVKKEINSVDDLYKLGFADENLLREKPTEYFVPKKVWKEERSKILHCESSGTTGPRKYIPWHQDFSEYIIKWYNFNLDNYGVPLNENWIAAGPGGLFEDHIKTVARSRGGFPFFFGIDPKHAKKSLEEGKFIENYTHLFEEMNALSKKEKIGVVVIVPQLSEILPNYLNMNDLKAVLFGGVGFHGEPEEYRKGLKSYRKFKEIFKGKITGGWYGNAFWGPAFHLSDESDNLNYYPPYPYTVFEVINPKNPEEKVKYEKRGRVKFHRLTKEFFWPNALERDAANRIRPKYPFNWDGVQNVGPIYSLQ